MTPTLRTVILDALMERWREGAPSESMKREQFLALLTLEEPIQREYLSSCLDMILPVAEPMIRQAALREACEVACDFARTDNEDSACTAMGIGDAILALGEPK